MSSYCYIYNYVNYVYNCVYNCVNGYYPHINKQNTFELCLIDSDLQIHESFYINGERIDIIQQSL